MGNEIEAMGQLDSAISGLEDDERERVLAWAVAKFGGGTVKLPAGGGSGGGGEDDDAPAGETGPKDYERVSDLVDAANPSSGLQYVLLGSYWFQQVQGEESFTG